MNDKRKSTIITESTTLKEGYKSIYDDMVAIQKEISGFSIETMDASTKEKKEETLNNMKKNLKSIARDFTALVMQDRVLGYDCNFSLVDSILYNVSNILTFIKTFLKEVFKGNFSTASKTASKTALKATYTKIVKDTYIKQWKCVKKSSQNINKITTFLAKNCDNIYNKVQALENDIPQKNLENMKESIEEIKKAIGEIKEITAKISLNSEIIISNIKKHDFESTNKNADIGEPDNEYSVSSSSHLDENKDKEKGDTPSI